MGRPLRLLCARLPGTAYRLSPSYRTRAVCRRYTTLRLPSSTPVPGRSAHTQERLGEEVDREIPRCASPRCSCRSALRPRFGVDAACEQATVGMRCGKRQWWKKNRKRTMRDCVVCSHRARVLPYGRVVLRIAGSPLFFPPAYLCWTNLLTLHLGAARDSSCCTVFGTHDNDARVYVGMADVEEKNVSFAGLNVHVHRDSAADTENKYYGALLRLPPSPSSIPSPYRPAPPPHGLARSIYSVMWEAQLLRAFHPRRVLGFALPTR
ncbi:hypothetical protein B0H14DRAFT_528257 [Mycena olivaceomarginata]|nr:hypothetical protein B0H14DRAFT_528257 [Mycena olivaceomarginata]